MGTVRPATPGDAPIVRDIARESWHAAYDDILGPERVDETTDEWYAVDDLEESIADAAARDDVAFLLAAGDDRDVVGFAHAGVHPDEESIASLIRLYARPSAWGSGVGTALLERIESELSACERLRAVVLADNAVGRSFYESNDFERTETRPSDLEAGLEECVYEKRLP